MPNVAVLVEMITKDFFREQLHAVPFVPFTVVVNSGDRYNIKTADHADIPPDAQGDPSDWVIVYNKNSVPRYLALENIASLEHNGVQKGKN